LSVALSGKTALGLTFIVFAIFMRIVKLQKTLLLIWLRQKEPEMTLASPDPVQLHNFEYVTKILATLATPLFQFADPIAEGVRADPIVSIAINSNLPFTYWHLGKQNTPQQQIC
jgi:hypothetical protein